MNKKSILFILPQKDFNEEEYLIIKKIIENSGYNVFIASDSVNLCVGSKNMKVKNDILLYNANEKNFVALILIGGSGTKPYWENKFLHSLIKKFNSEGKTIGAICSASMILAKAGILQNVTATIHNDYKKELISLGIDFKDTPLVIRKNIITANSPSAAVDFSNAILENIKIYFKKINY